MIGGEVAPPWRMDSESTVKFTMLPNWQTQPWMDGFGCMRALRRANVSQNKLQLRTFRLSIHTAQ